MTWPPRWEPGTTHFKGSKTTKVARVKKARAAKAEEDKEKAQVRKRDKRCRFPLCGCKEFGIRCEVSHAKHKGMGGNPRGDRSKPELMMYLCEARHKGNVISIDKGTLKWEALTRDGADGPVRWLVDMSALFNASALKPKWFEVANETAVQQLARLTPKQANILATLRGMEL